MASALWACPPARPGAKPAVCASNRRDMLPCARATAASVPSMHRCSRPRYRPPHLRTWHGSPPTSQRRLDPRRHHATGRRWLGLRCRARLVREPKERSAVRVASPSSRDARAGGPRERRPTSRRPRVPPGATTTAARPPRARRSQDAQSTICHGSGRRGWPISLNHGCCNLSRARTWVRRRSNGLPR
jgi:hypothetical protein